MDFNIHLSTDPEPNTATIIVYNLSPESRGKIRDKHQSVELYASYNGEEFLLFKGEISEIEHRRVGNEWRTIIEVGDGQKSYEELYFSKSFTEGTAISDIISDLSNQFELPVDIQSLVPENIRSGISLDGKVKDVLNEIAGRFGFDWSVQQGVLEVTKPREPSLAGSTAVVIRGDTGLLEPPTRTDDSILVKTMILPGIRPKGLMRLQSRSDLIQLDGGTTERQVDLTTDGLYLIDQVRMIGNNYNSNFQAVVEAVQYGS